MELSFRESGGVHIANISGRLTIGQASEQLNTELDKLLLRGAKKIVLILDDVPQIDSSGISALVKNSITLTHAGGELRLVCGQGRVRDALTVTRLVEAIPTFETEAAALAGFS